MYFEARKVKFSFYNFSSSILSYFLKLSLGILVLTYITIVAKAYIINQKFLFCRRKIGTGFFTARFHNLAFATTNDQIGYRKGRLRFKPQFINR